MTGNKLIILNFTWAALALSSYIISTGSRDDAVPTGEDREETKVVGRVTILGSQRDPERPKGELESIPPDEVAVESQALSDVETAIALQEAAQARREQQRADYFASTVTSQNALSMLEEFTKTPRDVTTDRMFLQFLESCGKVAGQEVISLALESIPNAGENSRWGTPGSLETIMTGWASESPAAAMEFIDSLEDESRNPEILEYRSAMQVGILQELRRSDLDAAIAYSQQFYVDTLPSWRAESFSRTIDYSNGYRRNYLQGLESVAAAVEVQRGLAGLQSWVFGLEAETPGQLDYKRTAASNMLATMREESPEQAASWVAAHAGDGFVSGFDIVAASRVFADTPEGQIEWIAALPGDVDRKNAMYGPYYGWIREDFDAAGAWLARQPLGAMYDMVIARYANESATDDPEAARLWANEIKEDRLRRIILKDIEEAQ